MDYVTASTLKERSEALCGNSRRRTSDSKIQCQNAMRLAPQKVVYSNCNKGKRKEQSSMPGRWAEPVGA